MTASAAEKGTWWGEHEVDIGEAGRFRVGPLRTWLERHNCEWRLVHTRGEVRDDPTVEVICPYPIGEEPPNGEEPRPEDAPISRMLAESPGKKLRIVPVLADRPVITRPDGSGRVLAGTEVDLFVSTPLWFRIEAIPDDEQGPRVLFEQAIVRPSDTWFGATTRDGELCYSSRTPATLEAEELPNLPSRAITRLTISNPSSDDLDLLRFALPAPNLSLWLDRNRPELGLFTSSVLLVRSGDGETTRVEIQHRAPRHLGEPERIASPRSPRSRNVLSRAMSAILS